MIAILIFAVVSLLAVNAQPPQYAQPPIDCNFAHAECQHGFDRRVKILHMFARVWNQCPDVTALDRNIGYLERDWDVNRVIREHVRGDFWPVKYIYGRDSTSQVHALYDVYLARRGTREEVAQSAPMIDLIKDYKVTEDQIDNSPESFARFRNSNSVPGCGRQDLDCTWILDSITRSHCRLFRECPRKDAYLEESRLYGTGDEGTPMMIHRHYINSPRYEQQHIAGKSPQQKVQTLYRHLLNRDVAPTDDISGLLQIVDGDYRRAVVHIQNSPEYQTNWGKWIIPGNDINGQDINVVNLSFTPPC